jgi:hypothetical protein
MGERLTDHGGEVRTAYDRNGDRHIGWVMPEMTWRGRQRWRGRVEREFVTWHLVWRSRRYKNRDCAVAAVHRVLDRVEAHERWERA